MSADFANITPAFEDELTGMANGDALGFAKTLGDRFAIYGAKAVPPIRLFVHVIAPS